MFLLMLKGKLDMCRLCLSIHSVCLKIVICYYLIHILLRLFAKTFHVHTAQNFVKNRTNYHYPYHNTLIGESNFYISLKEVVNGSGILIFSQLAIIVAVIIMIIFSIDVSEYALKSVCICVYLLTRVCIFVYLNVFYNILVNIMHIFAKYNIANDVIVSLFVYIYLLHRIASLLIPTIT